MKKIFLIIAAVFLMSSFSYEQTLIPPGNVSGNWTSSGSPYLVQGSVMIPDGSTLSIEPGVVVNFQGPYKLYTQGRLLAIGSATDTIFFTSADTTVGWLGLHFNNTPITNDTSKIFYCNIQYGKTSGDGGAFYFVNCSKVIVSNCRITDCISTNSIGGIIDCEGSNPVITLNTISYNTASNGGGIYCSFCSPVITHNIISNNKAANGGGIFCQMSSPVIRNNIISHNVADGSGGGIFCSMSNSDISNNLISNNTAYNGGGLYFYYDGNPCITNNTVSNNTAFAGGGICCDYTYGNPVFINNTITSNSAATGGGLVCSLYSNGTLYNTILWGNTAETSGQQVYLSDENSDPGFYYCDVQGGTDAFGLNGGIFYTGVYQNNLDTIPVFVSPSAGSGAGFDGVTAGWSLQETSPCINAGIPDTAGLGLPALDLAGNPRIRGGRIDMGAFEYAVPNSIHEVLNAISIDIYPNPVIHKLTVEIQQKSEIEILNINGQIIKTIHSNTAKTTIDIGDLPVGFYLLKAKTDHGIAIKKFIKK